MDPHHSAQDVARCDLCETAQAQSHCDFCHVSLCKSCIGSHIEDDYDIHKIVPYQRRKSTLIYPKCGIHQHKLCDHLCKNCNVSICSFCFASKQHNGHETFVLKEVYNEKKEGIEKDTEEVSNLLIPMYEEIALDLEKQIACLDGEYEILKTEMFRKGEEWHKEITNVINEIKEKMDEIKLKHRDILMKHLEEVKETQSIIQQMHSALKHLEESTEILPTIQYISKNAEFCKLPPKPEIAKPQYIAKPIDSEKLRCLIGELVPLSTTMKERVFTAQKPSTVVRELLNEPYVLHTIETGHEYLRSVAFLNEEQLWTSGESHDIKCFNIQGVQSSTMNTKSGNRPNDIAIHKDGALVYSDGPTRTVYKVKNGETEEIIQLQGWTPFNLCVTSSGDLLVTMYSDNKSLSKVVRYSGSNVKQTIQFDDEDQPLYSGNDSIKYICVNRNLDICVADCEAGAVVVVNQAGKLRFRYTGHSSPNKNEPFVPSGIITDSQSHILTADCDNHYIHLLNAEGQFLRYIDNCNVEKPLGIIVDKNDNLFVCEYEKGIVKEIKYIM